MNDKVNKILIPYSVEYQLGPMEENYKGTAYFDLTQYYKYKHKDKLKKKKEWEFSHSFTYLNNNLMNVH